MSPKAANFILDASATGKELLVGPLFVDPKTIVKKGGRNK